MKHKQIATIGNVDLSVIGSQIKTDSVFRTSFIQFQKKGEYPAGPIKMNTEASIADWLNNLYRYDITKYSNKLVNKKILLIGGWQDLDAPIEDHILPLFRILNKTNKKNIKIILLDTDHSFSNVSNNLNQTLESWIKQSN